jgi:hypothetical protein
LQSYADLLEGLKSSDLVWDGCVDEDRHVLAWLCPRAVLIVLRLKRMPCDSDDVMDTYYLRMCKLLAWWREVLIADPDARVLWLLLSNLLLLTDIAMACDRDPHMSCNVAQARPAFPALVGNDPGHAAWKPDPRLGPNGYTFNACMQGIDRRVVGKGCHHGHCAW